jgi:cytochrome c6
MALLVCSLARSTTAFAELKKQAINSRGPLHTALATTAMIILIGSTTTATALAADGVTLFQAQCAGCHGGGLNFINEKKTLKKEALEKYLSLNQPVLQGFVRNKMPHKMLPFSQSFTDDDYKAVTSYVLDQALGDKW